MRQILIVGGGGLVGAILRYLTVNWAQRQFVSAMPVGTLIVNIVGSFLIGLLMTLSRETGLISPELRLLLVTGLLGGFTTFSAFSYETLGQLTGQSPALGVLNIMLNVGVGLAAAWGGIVVGRAV